MDLARWGRDAKGDWRVVAGAALVGAVFFLLLWGTTAQAFGEAALPAGAAAAGVLAFAALWASFGMLAANGWSRVAFAAVVGHVVGFVALAANLVIAVADGTDTTFAVLALFGFTALGLAVGLPLEWVARRRRAAAP